MSLPVAILAGGLATRLHPVTARIPKSLVDVAGKPFAEHQISLLRERGLTDLVFLVGHLEEAVRSRLGDGRRWGVRLRYISDGARLLGTGGAIRQALSALGDQFFVLYGDSYLECDYSAIERTFMQSGKSGLMTVCRNDDRWDQSNVVFRDGRIVHYDKQARTPDMHHIDYGLGVFRRTAFTGDQPEHEASDLVAVYQRLVKNEDLAGFEVSGRFYEIGSAAGLEEARGYLAGKDRL